MTPTSATVVLVGELVAAAFYRAMSYLLTFAWFDNQTPASGVAPARVGRTPTSSSTGDTTPTRPGFIARILASSAPPEPTPRLPASLPGRRGVGLRAGILRQLTDIGYLWSSEDNDNDDGRWRKWMRVPLSHQAEAQIRAYIVAHSLTPGDALPPEGELAAKFGMSKASIREGLRRLEMVGIVEVRHGTGLFVGEFSLDLIVDALPYGLAVEATPLHEILQVRCALEKGLVVAASQAMSAENLDALDALVAQMVAESTSGEVPADVDRAFHQSLFAPLHNELLSQLIDVFWKIYGNFDTARTAAINHHGVEDHALIVAAIRSGDAERMVRAVARHFDQIHTTVQRGAVSSDAPETILAGSLAKAVPSPMAAGN